MNTIQKNSYWIYLGIILLNFGNCYATTTFRKSNDSSFSISISASINTFSNLPIRSDKYSNIDYAPSFQLLILPGYKLNIGLETSIINLSKQNFHTISHFGTTNFKGNLNAIPILLVFNRKVWEIDISGGLGISRLKSKINAFDTNVVTTVWHYCYFYSIGYTYEFSYKFGLGIYIKAYSFPKIGKNIGGVAFKMSYKI